MKVINNGSKGAMKKIRILSAGNKCLKIVLTGDLLDGKGSTSRGRARPSLPLPPPPPKKKPWPKFAAEQVGQRGGQNSKVDVHIASTTSLKT